MIFFLQTIMLIYSLQSWSFPSYDVNTKFTVGKNFDDGGGINRIEADQFLNALKLKIPPLLLNCNTSLISEWFRIIGKVKESDMMSNYLNEDFSFNKIDDVNRRLYAGRIMNRDRQRNYDHHKNEGQFHYYNHQHGHSHNYEHDHYHSPSPDHFHHNHDYAYQGSDHHYHYEYYRDFDYDYYYYYY